LALPEDQFNQTLGAQLILKSNPSLNRQLPEPELAQVSPSNRLNMAFKES
jgi:hypothetical protein